MIKTPYYIFNIGEVKQKINYLREYFPNFPITYSIKANPFIVKYIEEYVDNFEVCSPGELEICIKYNVNPNKIIYSGVMKEYEDILRAVNYGVKIITIESYHHYELIDKITKKYSKSINFIIRLTSGNQFGMEESLALDIIGKHNNRFMNFYGFHLYSGTQKYKEKQYLNDFDIIKKLSDWNVENRDLFFEYGPGLPIDYFSNEDDNAMIKELSALFEKYHISFKVGLEFGRFIASSCGEYHTTVKDLKKNDGINYVILDGGIHHLKYYGQIMAMQVPVIEQVNNCRDEMIEYCLCGSLCTVADVLVRNVVLKRICIDDEIVFKKCGAYSMTEGSSLFLSRNLPGIYISVNDELICCRNQLATYEMNS